MLQLMDEAAAAHALATLSDANVLGQTVPLESEDLDLSWVEHHMNRCLSTELSSVVDGACSYGGTA